MKAQWAAYFPETKSKWKHLYKLKCVGFGILSIAWCNSVWENHYVEDEQVVL